MKLDAYAKWVWDREVNRTPPEQLRSWRIAWSKLFATLKPLGQHAVFETAALVVGRWEFLGGLVRGDTDFEPNANRLRVEAFAFQFLAPGNVQYGDREVLSALYTMLRNKPIHGLVPAGVANGQEVLTWWVGQTGIDAANHLRVDSKRALHVNCSLLADDLATGLERFAASLAEEPAGEAANRFRRSFWARFCPTTTPVAQWMKLGADRGLPPGDVVLHVPAR